MEKLFIAVVVASLSASPLVAGHANPWATDEDNLEMQYHEENLAQSEDTPGEDEMLGVMVQSARGKLEGTMLGRSGGGYSAGQGVGVGRGNRGGNGGSGNGHGGI
jgi:hypothetical protein